jgi:hypothetical protein
MHFVQQKAYNVTWKFEANSLGALHCVIIPCIEVDVLQCIIECEAFAEESRLNSQINKAKPLSLGDS